MRPPARRFPPEIIAACHTQKILGLTTVELVPR